MHDSNYHYLTSSLTSFGQPFDNRISKRISTPISETFLCENVTVTYTAKRAGKAVRTRVKTKRPMNVLQ
ncbi:Protein of unknown function [Bacillus wiedmannii]|nr:Protein of unknown function [Bacillus wiedmannii]